MIILNENNTAVSSVACNSATYLAVDHCELHVQRPLPEDGGLEGGRGGQVPHAQGSPWGHGGAHSRHHAPVCHHALESLAPRTTGTKKNKT